MRVSLNLFLLSILVVAFFDATPSKAGTKIKVSNNIPFVQVLSDLIVYDVDGNKIVLLKPGSPPVVPDDDIP
jgi:hypothetical protein